MDIQLLDRVEYCVTINPWLFASVYIRKKWRQYGVLSIKDQKLILKVTIEQALRHVNVSTFKCTFEFTKKGNYHVHGILDCSPIQCQEFKKYIFDKFGHKKQTMRNMDTCILVKQRFTDGDEWMGYMTKHVKTIEEIHANPDIFAQLNKNTDFLGLDDIQE